ncbi:MAG: hypothetical protein KC609_10325 [Myxococcales bacterium]|nr:hypothetical protein [Myxococcales bacterium]
MNKCMIVFLGALLAAVGAKAQTPKFRLVHKVTLPPNQEFGPKRYLHDDPRVLDRGRLLLFANGLHEERDTFHILRLDSFQRQKLRAPIAEFLAYHIELTGSGNKVIGLRLLFLDTTNQEAGLQLTLRDPGGMRLVYFLHWDLSRGRITRHVRLAEDDGSTERNRLRAIGYDANQRAFYFLKQQKGFGGSREARVYVWQYKQLRQITRFAPNRRIKVAPIFDARRHRALVIEYGEMRESQPLGYLIDLQQGQVRSLRLPITTYGAIFHPRLERLYAYSSKSGELQQIDLSTGRVERTLKVGVNGHALGIVANGWLALVRNNQLQLYNLDTLKRGSSMATGRLARGFFHASGSTIRNRRIIVKNGRMIFLLSVGTRGV